MTVRFFGAHTDGGINLRFLNTFFSPGDGLNEIRIRLMRLRNFSGSQVGAVRRRITFVRLISTEGASAVIYLPLVSI